MMTWNVHGSASPDPVALAAVIREAQPDVVALQEIRPRQAVAVADALRLPSPLWSLKHLGYGPLWWMAEGLALLSPLPQQRGRAFPIGPTSWPFTFRRRIAQRLEITAAGTRVRCWHTHLASQADPADRVAQAERLARLDAADEPVSATVVLGDLNLLDGEPLPAPLVALGLADAWEVAFRRVGSAHGCTSPAGAPVHRLDRVLVRGLAVEEIVVPDPVAPGAPPYAVLSDHLPVVVAFRI
jgi:endonuclease/exonuclease/phosphatase family metal-dependent hydrolase